MVRVWGRGTDKTYPPVNENSIFRGHISECGHHLDRMVDDGREGGLEQQKKETECLRHPLIEQDVYILSAERFACLPDKNMMKISDFDLFQRGSHYHNYVDPLPRIRIL
ncbi:hypothetical protein CDAR_59231 [Caerostris darwini]|uniref:Uncharacterized protein n=1 Tax=Caerostris darwini TaxID=1538125 RepID=A0AAV4X507_9ARAC|nr:hypothetical protein CDAR_59231 [Caerostris darwini]